MKRFVVTAVSIILFLTAGINYGVESIPDDVKRSNPQYYAEYVKYSYQISLPAGMRKALEQYDPDFKILKMEEFADELRIMTQASWDAFSDRACYSAVFEDFNGDGRLDAALLGRAEKIKDVSLLLVILSEGNRDYQVVELDRFGSETPETLSIGRAEPGKMSEACGGRSFEIKNPGITTIKGYGVTVIYWDGQEKKFKEIATGGC